MENWLVRARSASGKTEQDCARAICQPPSVYRELERCPGDLTLNEIAALCRLFDSSSVAIVEAALLDVCR